MEKHIQQNFRRIEHIEKQNRLFKVIFLLQIFMLIYILWGQTSINGNVTGQQVSASLFNTKLLLDYKEPMSNVAFIVISPYHLIVKNLH